MRYCPGRATKYPIGNTPKPAAHVKSPKGREIHHWKYPKAPLVGLGGASSVPGSHCREARHIGTAAAAGAAGAELPQHPLPVCPPWGICNKHQIKCVHWGHHFRAKVPGVGAVTLGIHHAKYPKWRSLGYSGPEYPKKGQEYTKNGNTPKNTPGISRGVFNPGYSFRNLRSVGPRSRRTMGREI